MYQCGDILDQYQLTKRLGSGAYGVVFEAENTVSKQKCALKIVPLCGKAGGRELRALRQYHDLEHPNLLKVHHSGIVGDYLYYTMDLAEGNLADRQIAPAQLRSAAIKIADALATLHANGLLHRDLKPDNFFFLNGEPLIGDIGLVTVDCGASLTGTPGFIPPSVRERGAALSEASDLYALAKSFYCLLSGNSSGKYPKYNGPLDPDSAILLQAVLDVCDENGRITSAAEFRDFLRKGVIRKPRWKSWLLTLGIVFLIAAVTTGFFLLMPNRGERMFAEVQKANQTSPAEQAAIDRQDRIAAKLEQQIKNQMENKLPFKKGMSRYEWQCLRYNTYITLLEKAVREQGAKSPEFHCFYILWQEAGKAAYVLLQLEDDPVKYAKLLEKDFQRWRRKYAEYCKERDALLSRSKP